MQSLAAKNKSKGLYLVAEVAAASGYYKNRDLYTLDWRLLQMRECSECKWCVDITDSLGRSIYFCADAGSDSYLEETGICGSCELDSDTNIAEA
jgi:hypothetical protein